MNSTAPEILTDRLCLRAHRASDFEDCVALWTDPAVTAFIGGTAFARDAIWTRLLRYAGMWSVLGYGYWAICDRQSGRFLGEAGLADFKRDMTPALGDTPETGWALRGEAHGRGLATEAMQAVLDWSDRSLEQAETCCIISDDNPASLRVADKLGYRPAETGQLGENPVRIFRRPRKWTP